jgi:MFS-type transporter involved in bile tolerance (Atg22 family)
MAKVTGVIALILAGIVALYLASAWLLMLTVGMVHGEWLHSLPTMGWHAAWVLALPLGILFGGSAAAARSGKG